MNPVPAMTAPATRSKKRPPARTYDLDVVGRLDRVTAPKQARSEASLQRVLSALEELLQTRPFVEVSIPDIATKAQCSAATIYGRFQDKGSILAALHESLRERMRGEIDTLLAPERWSGSTIEALTEAFCVRTLEIYHVQRHLVTAMLILGDREIYEGASQLIYHAASRLGEAAAKTRGGKALDADQTLFAVRCVFALLQQRLLFGSASFGQAQLPTDADFAAALSTLLRGALRPKR